MGERSVIKGVNLHNIAIDAMGGDNAPSQIILGAINSITSNVKIFLVGREEVINSHLKTHTYDKTKIEIINATEVIGTEETTMAIKKKKDSSLAVGLKLLKEGHASSFISAGSTGALLTGATLKIKRLQGIDRPALGTMLPCQGGFTLMLDSGANVDCKPHYLLQFAQLGSAYMQHVIGINKPKVALVNIGSEKEKGNNLTKEAMELILKSNLNFVGNIEARDIAKGNAHVIVCDGFVGNVILKTAEGYSKFIFETIKKELMSTTITKVGALLSKPAFNNIKKTFDYSEVGGAPFLGLTSLVIKTHGSSKSKDIIAATRQSIKFIESDIINKLKSSIANT